MAAADRRGHPTRNSLYWDETHALNYYGMMSLHEVFEIVGSQLTVTDVEALSFLLNETYSALHPLDPAGWTVEPSEGNPDVPGIYPSPELLKTWRRIKPQSSQDSFHPLCKPTSGPELLLDLERRGYISDGNLEPLLQLLRVLTRHDLLLYVSHKKRRRVSPERINHNSRVDDRGFFCTPGTELIDRHTEIPLPSFPQQQRGGAHPGQPVLPAKRRRKKRGNGWSRKPKKTSTQGHPPLSSSPQVSCSKCISFTF